MKSIRLDSLLSEQGFAARRKIESFLKENPVIVNGERIMLPGTRINPDTDDILVSGKKLPKIDKVYFILNKPVGIVSTASDEKGRKNVVSLVKSKERLFPVGRLDRDSEGIILLTNDGDLANIITHPRFGVPKTYDVLVAGEMEEWKLNKLRSGVRLNDGVTRPADIEEIKNMGRRTLLRLTFKEGKKRQIRRMCSALQLEVQTLRRISIGGVELGTLQPGKSRQLTDHELKTLKSFAK